MFKILEDVIEQLDGNDSSAEDGYMQNHIEREVLWGLGIKCIEMLLRTLNLQRFPVKKNLMKLIDPSGQRRCVFRERGKVRLYSQDVAPLVILSWILVKQSSPQPSRTI